MKVLKWVLLFLIAFTISFILLRTFSQPIFQQKASAWILGYTTPAIALYWYVAGSFIIGFLIGLAAVINNVITSITGSMKKSKRIKELEKELDFLSEHQADIASQTESRTVEESTDESQSGPPAEQEMSGEADDKKAVDDKDINSFVG